MEGLRQKVRFDAVKEAGIWRARRCMKLRKGTQKSAGFLSPWFTWAAKVKGETPKKSGRKYMLRS